MSGYEDEHYTDTPEWAAVQHAVQALVEAMNEGRTLLITDMQLTTFSVPMDQEVARAIGSYAFYGTSPFPHINRGLALESLDYWDDADPKGQE